MATQKSLNKVYDLIDAQPPKYKQALKLLNQNLAKQPDWQMCKALKALVVVRMGGTDEAAKLAASIADAKPTDEQVLGMMVHVYKELGSKHSIAELWSSAWDSQPDNLEFAFGVFASHVRLGEHNKQQMAAMKMYKTFSNDLYLMWAVVSILTQVRCGADSRLLSMAEMLLRRSDALKEPKIRPEVCELMLLVLEEQGASKQQVLLESVSEGGLLFSSPVPEQDLLKVRSAAVLPLAVT
eukprot:SAG31_NODE_721_length_12587_cov_5.502002_2_plen_239_part_00